MQVKSIAEHSEILSTFIKLTFVIKIGFLSIFERPLKTGFTVNVGNGGNAMAPLIYTMDYPLCIGLFHQYKRG